MDSPRYSASFVQEYVDTTPSISDPPRVWRLDEMIVKFYVSESDAIREALNSHMVRTMTTIPVPEIHQIVADDQDCSYVIMQFIEGQTLDVCWPQLGLFAKLKLAWKIRGYISQLRRLRRSVPGTLNGGVSVGYFFGTMDAGPFASYDDMTAWFNHKLEVSQRMQHAPSDAPRFDNSWPLVFTHLDLHPRNLLLSNDGTLYVIDWQVSGFYPEWFEYANMWNSSSPTFWKFLVPFMAGFHGKMMEYYRNIGWAVVVGVMM